MPIDVSTKTFEQEVEKSDKPVLVDFWAVWCMPCKMMAPIIDEFAKSTDKIKVCKVNIDENPELANKFNIMSIPTIGLFKDGKLIKTTVGVQPKEKIEEFLKEYI